MKQSARYVKIVEWSKVDGCYVGSCPGLHLGGCHGADERAVFAELCEIVEETIDLYHADGKPLPPSTAGRGLTSRLQEQNVASRAPSGGQHMRFWPATQLPRRQRVYIHRLRSRSESALPGAADPRFQLDNPITVTPVSPLGGTTVGEAGRST